MEPDTDADAQQTGLRDGSANWNLFTRAANEIVAQFMTEIESNGQLSLAVTPASALRLANISLRKHNLGTAQTLRT